MKLRTLFVNWYSHQWCNLAFKLLVRETNLYINAYFLPLPWQRPYHVENTSSRPITEVKQRWARLVLGWETAWEPLVQLSFSLSTCVFS